MCLSALLALSLTQKAESAAPPAAAPQAKTAAPAREKTLDDYRHFRIATIDLTGRMPTREEIAAFERPDFDYDAFVRSHLTGPGYSERLTRIYMDLLRLEPNVNFATTPAQLLRHEIIGPDGKPEWIYYREGQRRTREEVDGEFCLSPEETGVPIHPRMRNNEPDTKKKVSKKALDDATVLVKPWWLYKDYDAQTPERRYQASWNDADAEYRPVEALINGQDGKPVTQIRVCREEAQEAETGHVLATGKTKQPPKLPGSRVRPLVLDSAYAQKHKGEALACSSKLALASAADCGCGKGLARCVPGDSDQNGPSAFYFPNHTPLGPQEPIDSARQQAQRWFPHWWAREALAFLEDLFGEDRDFREILTGKHTFVNGPLAQFYGSVQRGNCCGPETTFGMTEEAEPLFDPQKVPADLRPHDTGTWRLVPDRGPHAAGILTMPMFLEKYASARARGALLYNAFLCKSFVADSSAQLAPSTEPNLMKRPGCSTCHATLEPLAAYFARVEPGSFVFLPQAQFPVQNPMCKKDKNGRMSGPCTALYDPAFADNTTATLRSAYGSPAHADATPAGAAHEITESPEFASCAVERVTSSFLGRPTTPDDAPMLAELTKDFKSHGYKMRVLVAEIMRSPEYRRSNNLSGDAWRGGTDAGAAQPKGPPAVQDVHGGSMGGAH